MSEPDLAAIRARLEKAQADHDQAEADGSVWMGPSLLTTLWSLLSLVARLQGEREGLALALCGTASVRLGDSSLCWCPYARHHGDARRTDHTDACRAARAALGEE